MYTHIHDSVRAHMCVCACMCCARDHTCVLAWRGFEKKNCGINNIYYKKIALYNYNI